jgi:hypothetical protein
MVPPGDWLSLGLEILSIELSRPQMGHTDVDPTSIGISKSESDPASSGVLSKVINTDTITQEPRGM